MTTAKERESDPSSTPDVKLQNREGWTQMMTIG